MLTGELWPAHPHTYQGECLSSWIVRTAHHNGLKIQTFSDLSFGKHNQIWNRDIDKLAPSFVLQTMSNRAAISLKEINKTTLKLYINRLFPALKPSGIMRWINPLVLHHRKHTGFGMQFCPLCLLEDSEPYFRIAWRLSLYTFCPIHQVMMEDRCSCGASVNFHRIELGKANQFAPSTLDECYQCGLRLGGVEPKVIQLLPKSVYTIWNRVLGVITRGFVNSGPINYERLILLHQICKIIVSPRFNQKIIKYICDKSDLPVRDFGINRYFEQFDVNERHYILQLAWWLVGNTNKKLKESIRKNAMQNNYLYRDSRDKMLHYLLKQNF
ncbi:TniQ family protein [Thalassotalea sp. 1_MG-2023]|uniref:TniQ family protein n=1 Tax=Thalassotalea sp. 1_MG-2023 TaxID=3062680 RepID=UPI0026E41231|nr:TniQ family protein [Thalassotalea sp. 1_MG-2023]MDO6426559.1 TniQ family protein [Thalassotalea sp. 1_MG-2023]